MGPRTGTSINPHHCLPTDAWANDDIVWPAGAAGSASANLDGYAAARAGDVDARLAS